LQTILGHAYLLAQRNDEARSEFTTALKLDPQLDQAHYNRLRAGDEQIKKAGGTLRP
jgi:Flp pilus assembly protein TadD